jgi:hypothetical protein
VNGHKSLPPASLSLDKEAAQQEDSSHSLQLTSPRWVRYLLFVELYQLFEIFRSFGLLNSILILV